MKICYFGIYDPEFGRNKVYIRGLRELGHEVIECRDTSRGFKKYSQLKKKHAAIVKNGGYDALIVGYPGHIVVPLARRISTKPVIFDALCSLYEGEVISRGKYKHNLFKRWWIEYTDMKAVKAAHLTLVETNAQRDFFIQRFAADPDRVRRVFTGCDEEIFAADPGAIKRTRFTAVFRGKFLPEAGVKHIIKAAKLLEHEDIDFLILGHGFLEKQVKEDLGRAAAGNIQWIKDFLPPEEMAAQMVACHVSLGQFEMHERLARTIPHKAFESLALGIPYVTARSEAVSELLTDGKDCLMVSAADPEDLAAKILKLKNDPHLAQEIAQNGRRLFGEKIASRVLAGEIINSIPKI